jgi:hypothetical protein
MRRELENVQNKGKLLKMKPTLTEWKSLQCRDNRRSCVITCFAKKFMRCFSGLGYNLMKRNNKLNKQYVHRKKGEEGKLEKLIRRGIKRDVLYFGLTFAIL